MQEEFLLYNFHAHTVRCQHAFGTEREYIEAAIDMGIKKFGFSDHIPCPFKNGYVSNIRMRMDEAKEYVTCIRALGREYQKQIEIFVGFEAEYMPEFYEEQIKLVRELDCDYLILGQHFMESEQNGPYSGEPTKDEKRLCIYVDTVIEGMKTGSYTYLAHPDLINYQGTEHIYEREMRRLCLAMKELQIPLEINILGMRTNRTYPMESFWRLAGEIGNDVVFGIDAHREDAIRDMESYQKCMELAKRCGLHLLQEPILKKP